MKLEVMFLLKLFFLVLIIQKNEAFLSNNGSFDEDIPRNISIQSFKNPKLICYDNNNTVCRTDSEILNCVEAPNNIILCQDNNVTILDCFCADYNKETDKVEFGSCFYNCNRVNHNDELDDPYKTLQILNGSNLNDPCQNFFNREGSLCGSCRPGYLPLAYSYELACIKCSNYKRNVWIYLVYVYVPLTIFCMLIVLLKVNATASHLEGFIIVCQGVSLPTMARLLYVVHYYKKTSYMTLVKIVLTMCSIWNLDILRPLNQSLCLSLDNLSIFTLDLAIGAYPLVFVSVLYVFSNVCNSNSISRVNKVLMRPFRYLLSFLKVNTSLVDVFGTMFVLSHVKFVNSCFDLLLWSDVYMIPASGKMTWSRRWYYDANVVYFGEKHKPVAIVSLLVLLLSVGLPTLLFIIYPLRLFQKCLNKMSFIRWYVLHTFMDLFHACYKDGTKPGQRDCRWFVGVIIMTRFLLFLTGMLTLNAVFFSYAAMLLVLLLVVLLHIDPYKESMKKHYYGTFMFFILLAMFYASLCSIIEADRWPHHETTLHFCYAVALIVSFIPLLYFCYLILRWIFFTVLHHVILHIGSIWRSQNLLNA